MNVEVELSRVIINEKSDQQIILLQERDGERSFPIVIGIVEIFAIDRRLKGLKPPRPMTHDLLDNVIKGLGGEIEKIVITDLKQHTFYANIHIKKQDGGVAVIDSRPSDAIALGVASGVRLYVEESVFEKASQ